MATPRQLRSYGRLGLLATALVLAAALVAGAWLNYRGSRDAVATLHRGQADVLEAALRSQFPWRADVDRASLTAFVDSFPEYGVTYLAVIDSRGNVRASVGTPAGPLALPSRPGYGVPEEDYLRVGDQVRIFVMRGLEHRDHDAANSASAGNDGRGSRPSGFPGAPPLPPNLDDVVPTLLFQVADFEPVVANSLVAQASRSLALAVVSASILTLAALLFWRTSERYAAARARMEEQRRLSILGEMSAVMAHEIRNPLASLKGTAQLLAEQLPEDSRELLRAQRIVTEAIRLETLTSDLLDFARSGPIQASEVDPVELLRASVADVDGGGFDIDASEAPPRWRIDARRMRHALVNVLQNASQAAPARARPRVRVMTEQETLVFEVRDFGPGLPTDQEQRVFDPFFTTRTNGTGLGLAVAQRVAEMHGGRITAANHEGGGAVFRILLPPKPPTAPGQG